MGTLCLLLTVVHGSNSAGVVAAGSGAVCAAQRERRPISKHTVMKHSTAAKHAEAVQSAVLQAVRANSELYKTNKASAENGTHVRRVGVADIAVISVGWSRLRKRYICAVTAFPSTIHGSAHCSGCFGIVHHAKHWGVLACAVVTLGPVTAAYTAHIDQNWRGCVRSGAICLAVIGRVGIAGATLILT